MLATSVVAQTLRLCAKASSFNVSFSHWLLEVNCVAEIAKEAIMFKFTFEGSTNHKFDAFKHKACKLGTDGKHAMMRFADDEYITTTSVTCCSTYEYGVDANEICIETRNSKYYLTCYDKDLAFKVTQRLNDIADSNRLNANIIADVQSGLNIGAALAHAISDQVRGQRRVIC